MTIALIGIIRDGHMEEAGIVLPDDWGSRSDSNALVSLLGPHYRLFGHIEV